MSQVVAAHMKFRGWSRCIPVDYYSRFITNTVVGPAVLLTLVTATYAIDKKPRPNLEMLSPSELTRRDQERRTRQKSDYYFAFFLVCECLRFISLSTGDLAQSSQLHCRPYRV